MIETFVFASERVFLKEEDQSKIQQLLDYLQSREQQIGMVVYDQAVMNQVLLDHHLADYLDFSINGEEAGKIPADLVAFLKVELSHHKVSFISNSLAELAEAEKAGFTPIYIGADYYKEAAPCQSFEDFDQLHLGMIAHRFEKLM